MYTSKLKNKNIVCFKKEELQNIFSIAKKEKLLEEVKKQGLSLRDLQNDYRKMESLASVIADKTSSDTDDHEIFASIFMFVDFYELGSEICFELKDNFNTSKDKITTLNDLNNFRSDPPDFIIKSGDDFREFELKRYRNGLATNEVFSFLKRKIEYYGNGLGLANLLVMVQSKGGDISKVDFHKINTDLKSLNLKFQGQVLISYNENNQKMIINQVFPELTTTKIPFQLPGQKD